MNLMDPHKVIPQRNMEPPRPLPSFVFVDLREDPEAWLQIENELADDVNPAIH